MTRRLSLWLALLTLWPVVVFAQAPINVSGSLSATGSVAINAFGYGTVGLQITGTYVGTHSFEGTTDQDSWVAVNCTPPNSTTAATSTTSVGLWTCSVAGLQQFRVRMSAYTSGTSRITLATAPSGGGSGGGGSGSTQYAEDAVHGSGDSLMMAGAVRNAACGTALSGANGDNNPFQLDSNGNLCIAIAANSVGSATDTDDGTVAGGQASAALVIGLDYVWADGAWVRLVGPAWTDDSAFVPGTNAAMVAGFFADETATDSVDEGDVGAGRMTLDRKQIVTIQPHTTGGLTIFRSIDLDETEEEIKATAGQVYAAWFSNMATSTRFLKCYNATAANVTVGTTTPVITLALPGNASDDITGALTGGAHGVTFDTAITCAATTGIADADTGAPGANEVILNVFYR